MNNFNPISYSKIYLKEHENPSKKHQGKEKLGKNEEEMEKACVFFKTLFAKKLDRITYSILRHLCNAVFIYYR